MKLNYHISIILGSFLMLLGILSLYGGDPGKEYVLNNPNAFEVYFHSWLSHVSWTIIFFFFGILLLTKSKKKENTVFVSKNIKKLMWFVGIFAFVPYLTDLIQIYNLGLISEIVSDVSIFPFGYSAINLNFFLMIIGIVVLLFAYKNKKNK